MSKLEENKQKVIISEEKDKQMRTYIDFLRNNTNQREN